ncbi:hypothetical protein MUK42_36638 [Musa troglodytarum]|uniref:Uncharacterized protein n=1 Tax=Musa troglodytarum TaxID=320322 RepID=A0A9E7JXX0_9LILI|nr:hypothetical protein MUK42_36638 [Musa troglodytarum]
MRSPPHRRRERGRNFSAAASQCFALLRCQSYPFCLLARGICVGEEARA